MSDSKLEFDILLDRLREQGDIINNSADALQSLGRWLFKEDRYTEGVRAISLAEQLEESVTYKRDIDGDALELEKELSKQWSGNKSTLDPYVLSITCAFWCLVNDSLDRQRVGRSLNAIAEFANKNEEQEESLLAQKLILWLEEIK